MLQNRYQRIILPFLVFVFALGPAIAWGLPSLETAALGNGWPWTLAYEAAEEKTFWPEDTMHLWFLYDLIWFTALSALLTYGMSRMRISGQWFQGWVRVPGEVSWSSDSAIWFGGLVCGGRRFRPILHGPPGRSAHALGLLLLHLRRRLDDLRL